MAQLLSNGLRMRTKKSERLPSPRTAIIWFQAEETVTRQFGIFAMEPHAKLLHLKDVGERSWHVRGRLAAA